MHSTGTQVILFVLYTNFVCEGGSVCHCNDLQLAVERITIEKIGAFTDKGGLQNAQNSAAQQAAWQVSILQSSFGVRALGSTEASGQKFEASVLLKGVQIMLKIRQRRNPPLHDLYPLPR